MKKTATYKSDDPYELIIRQAVSAVDGRTIAEAESLARKALAVDYSRPEAFNILGIVMEFRHEREQAQHYYRAALSLNPAYDPARNNLDRLTGLRNTGVWDLGAAQ